MNKHKHNWIQQSKLSWKFQKCSICGMWKINRNGTWIYKQGHIEK